MEFPLLATRRGETARMKLSRRRAGKLQPEARISVAVVIGFSVLMLAGCGRTYHIKGRVVTLPQAKDSTGLIAEITGQQLPSWGEPVKGAKVRIVHELGKDGRPKEGTVWQQETLTDEHGVFEINDYAAPSDEVPVWLEVSKEGYGDAHLTYIDYVANEKHKDPQLFFVVLAPSSGQAAPR